MDPKPKKKKLSKEQREFLNKDSSHIKTEEFRNIVRRHHGNTKFGGLSVKEKNDLKRNQAERLIHKFGGARQLMRILCEVEPAYIFNPSTIYRWTYPKDRGGTGGVVPTKALKIIEKAARMHGIFLTSADLDPRDL